MFALEDRDDFKREKLSLESWLRPPMIARPYVFDAIGVGLIIALAAVLLPVWQADGTPYLPDIAGQMASYYLLPVMAFCLALRCGAIDLSVWINTALGGITAAVLIKGGVSIGWSFAAGAAAGLALGLVNASLVALLRLPSLIVTPVTAALALWALRAQFDQRYISVPPEVFENWLLMSEMPLLIARMLLVAAVYSVIMLDLLVLEVAARRGVKFTSRQNLFAALCVSGVLSASGGVCWLLDHGAAPVPGRLIGDLRVPAAAVLAGAIFLRGRGRTLLTCACLPASLLLATVWRQRVWNLYVHGYAMQMAVLAGMSIVAHLAARHWLCPKPAGGKLLGAVTAVMAAAGVIIVAAAGAVTGPAARAALHATGLAFSLTGAGVLITTRTLRALIGRKSR
ncbi:MAG: hypothetical protein SVT52_05780 [Planctomycetota bacterium]|nr:hypothetical protein [Planctomycetota bacterium]